MFFYIRSLRSDDCGAVNVIMGVLLVPLIGALGIGFEVSNWSMRTRGMQNAADAAALAAATNNSSNYDVEAKAVAARYGNQSLKQARGGSKFQEKARRARPVCQLAKSELAGHCSPAFWLRGETDRALSAAFGRYGNRWFAFRGRAALTRDWPKA